VAVRDDRGGARGIRRAGHHSHRRRG
jgi:hypothetical protein